MSEIRGMRGIRVEMWGIRVGIREMGVGMRGMGEEMRLYKYLTGIYKDFAR